MAETEIVVAENQYILNFAKPYEFEGVTYTDIDLSGLENINAATWMSVSTAVLRKNPSINAATLEMSPLFVQHLAARAAKQPLEFFENLPIKEAIKLKAMVLGFLYGED